MAPRALSGRAGQWRQPQFRCHRECPRYRAFPGTGRHLSGLVAAFQGQPASFRSGPDRGPSRL